MTTTVRPIAAPMRTRRNARLEVLGMGMKHHGTLLRYPMYVDQTRLDRR